MKKLLLSLAACAVAFGASADKVAFIMDGSQEFYTGDAKQVLVYCGQETTDFLPLSAEFGQISFTNTLFKVGAFRIKAESKITITPVEGITINKIVARQQIAGTAKDKAGLITGFTYDEATQTQSITGPINAAATVNATAEYETRFSWIEVDYSGTPTGICPPVFESTFPVVTADKTVKAVSATTGVTYQYKAGAEGTWAAVPADGFKVTEPNIYYVKAVKDGKESLVSANTFVPVEAGLKMATFTFNNWPDMVTTVDGKKFTKDALVDDGSNKSISVATGTTPETVTVFKDGNALFSVAKGTKNTKIYYSTTLGNTTDLRYYTNSLATFAVEDGYELVAAVVNGGELNNYKIWPEDGPSLFENCTCTMFPKSNKNWFMLTNKADNTTNSMSFKAGKDTEKDTKGKTKNYTGYMAHAYIFYRQAGGSGVADLTVDENAPVEYYNLQGVKVANPENGIFIRRQGTKVEKIMIK